MLYDCTLSGNSSKAGGGAIQEGGYLTVNNCTFSGNLSAASGGGIQNNSSLTLNNCTLAGNSAAGSLGGGGIYSFDAVNLLNNCTVSSNSATAHGGGIYNDGGSAFDLTNTIVAQNTAPASPDVFGAYSGVANFVGGNPELAPLGNYGGPTLTMPPLSGSPVINAGTDVVIVFLATDQRGYPRLSGRHVDIGAAEFQFAAVSAGNPPVLGNVVWSSGGGGSLQFNFTSVAGAEFTAITSTNLTVPLSNWTVLGDALELSPGQYQFRDSAATNGAQFYQIVSP